MTKLHYQCPGQIKVKFKCRDEFFLYTSDSFNLLTTDPTVDYIIDAFTGELLFYDEYGRPVFITVPGESKEAN